MKKCLLFLMLFSGISAFAQLPQKLKYDQLSYSFDSVTVLITSGKTMSVYDQVNQRYVVEPTKNELIHFPGSNNYAEIVAKTGQLNIYINVREYSTKVSGDASACYVTYQDPSTYPVIDCNGTLQHTNKNIFVPDTLVPGIFNWSKFSITKSEESTYNLISYAEGYKYLSLQDEWIFVDGFYHSGILDLNKNEWLIEPYYKECFQVNDFLFCLREIVYDSGREEFVYDIYHSKNGELMQIKTDVQEVDEALLYKLLDADTIIESIEPGYYVFGKDSQGSGVVKFTLFADENYTVPDLSYQILLEPVADFVLYEPYYSKLAVVFEDSLLPLRVYHIDTMTNKLFGLAGDSLSVHFNWFNADDGIRETVSSSAGEFHFFYDSLGGISQTPFEQVADYPLPGFGLTRINDTLLNVLNFFPGYGLVAYKSIVYRYEDSVDVDGNVPHYHLHPAFRKSGVYGLKSDSWVLQPECEHVFAGAENFMCLDEFDTYSCYDRKGNSLAAGLTGKDAYHNPAYLKYMTPYTGVTEFFDAPNGFFHHTQLKDITDSYSEEFHENNPVYYVRSNELLGLYKPDEWYRNTVSSTLYEFVHYNPSLNVTGYLTGDSIYLQSESGFFSAPKENGKLIYRQPDAMLDLIQSWQVIKIVGEDTVFYGEELKGFESVTTVSLELNGDILLVNDHTSKVSIVCFNCAFCEGCSDAYRDEYNYELYYESENSSVWKKGDIGWQKISPYYASIHPVKNGWYIASSGFYSRYLDIISEAYAEWMPDENADIPGRYMLLDSNFHAIPFLDYFDFPHIEDLGFGIKIKLDNGYYFFMTYDGVAVTDAEWHDFEIENGKLKAILRTTYLYDEVGNQVFDQFGNPEEATTETVKYFKLP